MPYVSKRSLNAQGALAVSGVQLPHNRHRRLSVAIPFGREPAVIQVCLSFSAECAFSLGTACYAPAVPCFGDISDILEQLGALTDAQQKTMPPALFVLAGDDPIGKGSLEYKSALDDNGVPTELITYDGALHGFIEENNPEYDKLHFHDSKSPEQEKMARQAEDAIGAWIAKQ